MQLAELSRLCYREDSDCATNNVNAFICLDEGNDILARSKDCDVVLCREKPDKRATVNFHANRQRQACVTVDSICLKGCAKSRRSINYTGNHHKSALRLS